MLISAKLVATFDTDDGILTEPLFCLLLSEDILLNLAQNFNFVSAVVHNDNVSFLFSMIYLVLSSLLV